MNPTLGILWDQAELRWAQHWVWWPSDRMARSIIALAKGAYSGAQVDSNKLAKVGCWAIYFATNKNEGDESKKWQVG